MPSDSVRLGYSYDDTYADFRRKNKIARLCLANNLQGK